MTLEVEPEVEEDVMRGGARSPSHDPDNESEIGSIVSNPLEDSEFVYRCKARHICSVACNIYLLALLCYAELLAFAKVLRG